MAVTQTLPPLRYDVAGATPRFIAGQTELRIDFGRLIGLPSTVRLAPIYDRRLEQLGISREEFDAHIVDMNQQIRKINGGPVLSFLAIFPGFFLTFGASTIGTLMHGRKRMQEIIDGGAQKMVHEWQDRGIVVHFEQRQTTYTRRNGDSHMATPWQAALVFETVAQGAGCINEHVVKGSPATTNEVVGEVAPLALGTPVSTMGAIDVASQIQEMAKLHNDKILSDAEFALAKQKLLQGMH